MSCLDWERYGTRSGSRQYHADRPVAWMRQARYAGTKGAVPGDGASSVRALPPAGVAATTD